MTEKNKIKEYVKIVFAQKVEEEVSKLNKLVSDEIINKIKEKNDQYLNKDKNEINELMEVYKNRNIGSLVREGVLTEDEYKELVKECESRTYYDEEDEDFTIRYLTYRLNVDMIAKLFGEAYTENAAKIKANYMKNISGEKIEKIEEAKNILNLIMADYNYLEKESNAEVIKIETDGILSFLEKFIKHAEPSINKIKTYIYLLEKYEENMENKNIEEEDNVSKRIREITKETETKKAKISGEIKENEDKSVTCEVLIDVINFYKKIGNQNFFDKSQKTHLDVINIKELISESRVLLDIYIKGSPLFNKFMMEQYKIEITSDIDVMGLSEKKVKAFEKFQMKVGKKEDVELALEILNECLSYIEINLKNSYYLDDNKAEEFIHEQIIPKLEEKLMRKELIQKGTQTKKVKKW